MSVLKIVLFSVIGLVCVAGIWFGLKTFGIIGGGREIPPEQLRQEEAASSSGFDMGEPTYGDLSDEMREAIEKKMSREGFLMAYGKRCLMSMKVPREIGEAGLAAYQDAYMRQVAEHCDNEDEANFAKSVFLRQEERGAAQFKKDGGEGCRQAVETLVENSDNSGLPDSIWHKALKQMNR